MKRLSVNLVISLFFIAFFINQVGAVTPHICSTVNDTIISLYDYSNSHAALWNDTQATVQICYSEIFGQLYDPAHLNTDAHKCSANTVLTLSSTFNAHSNGPGQNAYPVPVCYGDLSCTLVNSACGSGQREVLSLASPTNSHLERPEMNAFPNSYRVCCTSVYAGIGSGPSCGNGAIDAGEACDGANLNGNSCTTLGQGFTGGNLGCFSSGANACQFDTSGCSGGSQSIGEVHWEDSNGQKIGRSVGIGTNVNKTVRVVASSNFGAGTSVSFLIKESDPANDDTIRTVIAQADATGKTIATFRITDADIAAGNDGEFGVEEFYFVASAGSSSNQAEIVDVSMTQGPNSPPIANITAPVHRGVYYNGTTVTFNQSSYDDGPLTYSWTIAEDSYQDSRSSFQYAFKTPGRKTVTLKVTDEYGLWDEQEVTILVVASPGMLGYINNPFNKQVVPAQSNGILALAYSANESYVINNNVVNAGTCNSGVTCLAGNCPTHTENSPAVCGGGQIPINGGVKNFASVTFNWTLGSDGLQSNGVGDNYVMSSRVFSKDSVGPQTLSLLLSYNDTVVGISQTASRSFTLGQCVDNGHTFITINSLGKEISRSSTNTPACTGQDLLAGTNDDCCAAGSVCGDPSGENNQANYKCYGVSASSCAQYTTISGCASANPNVLKSFAEYTQSKCGQRVNNSIIDCSCSWSNSCFLNVTSHPVDNCGPQGCTNPPTSYQCLVLNYNEHECVNGYTDVDIVRQFIAGTGSGAITDPLLASPPCINETLTGVLCGRPAFDLDYGSSGSLIAAALLIGIVYALFYSFKKQ